MNIRKKLAILLFSVLSLQLLAATPDDNAKRMELRSLTDRLKYQSGKITLRDGVATINLPQSFRYLDPAGAETLLTGIWGNPPSETKYLGVIVPTGFDPFNDDSWCVVLDYQEDGYVNDQDAEKIDYNDLLKEMQSYTKKASAERVKDGYGAIELVGWAAAPRYDKQTHKFYWAKEIKFGGEEKENTLNYNLRILGRRGILVLNVVAKMSQLPQIEKATPQILGMVDFNEGHRYADYNPSTDKLATYGLAALVAGGIAAKTGLLKGLFVAILAFKKFILIGIFAVVGFVKKLLGGRQKPSVS
jgi:uncharacterized membrane-anchored protein